MHPYFSQAVAQEHISEMHKAASRARLARRVRKSSSRVAAAVATVRAAWPAGTAREARWHVRRA